MKALKITLVAVLGLAVAGFAWLWFAPCGLGGCAPVSDLERYHTEGSALLDADDRPFATLATVNRRIVSLDSLPAYLPEAFLAVEDRRFYDHGGVDWRRVAGAMVSNVRAGGVAEGGSTISMQLARNLFPDHLPYRERSIRRKLMEIRVARQIERAFDKRKILELYLNHIYLGEGAYGVEAASRTYFGKPASELTLAEAAVLGGLPQSPSRVNPRANRDAALRRRDLVLREMARAGYVPAAEAEEAIGSEMEVVRRAPAKARVEGAWFVERVRRELEERVGDRYYTAGLRVYTTYDPRAQRAAEREVRRQADAIEAGAFGTYRGDTYPEAKGETEGGSSPYVQGAAIILEAATGEVRALVGGRDFDDSQFDRIFQARRQPGSAFKPFVYLAALESGTPPTRQMEDAPVRIVLTGGETWEPRNYTNSYAGPMTVRDALAQSKNTVTVRLAQEVGMSRVIRTAHDMGVESEIPDVPSAALGAAEVRPAELAGAYATLANGGRRVEPHVIRRIESADGEVLYQAPGPGGTVVDPGVAFVLTSMLRDVVDRGTGVPARQAGFRGPAAGKTGTTNGASDVWFVGYTPDLVGLVWFGFDRPRTIVRGASGGTLAAPVWGRMMASVYQERRMPIAWTMPRNVVTEEVERTTGNAVDPACPTGGPTYTEYFVNVRPPRRWCGAPAYGAYAMDSVWIDAEWGGEGEVDAEYASAYLTGDLGYDPDTVGLGDPLPPLPPEETGTGTGLNAAGSVAAERDPAAPVGLRSAGAARRAAEGAVQGEGGEPPAADTSTGPRVLGRPAGGGPGGAAPPDTSRGAPGGP